MLKKIITVLLTIIGLVVIVYITITATSYSLSHDLALKIYSDAQTDRNFDGFVRYQTKLGKNLYETETDEYYISVYQVIVESNDGYENQLLIIIDAIDTVDFAINQTDSNDQMTFKVFDNLSLIHDTNTDQNYQGYAMSYGFDNDVLGFVFVGFEMSQSYSSLTFEITDYHGDLIVNDSIDFNYLSYDPEFEGYEGFLKAYTVDEISQMVNLNQVLMEQVSINILIYLIVVIFGLGIYFFLKKYFKRKNG